jgi:dipeptidyl aminopeptidase/acylaminoacyl peptidase
MEQRADRSAGAARLRRWLDHPRSMSPHPSWDGGSIHFLSDRNGLPQAWTTDPYGRPPTLLVPTSERVGAIRPSPAGPRCILSTDRGGNEHWQLQLVEIGEASPRTLTTDAERIHEPGHWADAHRFVYASNERDVRFFDVYVRDVDSELPARMIRREDSLQGVVAADGERTLVIRSNTNLDRDLILLQGESERCLTPHQGEETIFDAALGTREIYAASNAGREYAGLVRIGTNGSTPELLGSFQGDLEHLDLDRSAQELLLVVNHHGWSRIAHYSVATSVLSYLEVPHPGVVDQISWVPLQHRFVYSLSSPQMGQEILLHDLEERISRPLTRSPSPLPGRSAEPRLQQFRAVDGLTIPFWEYLPKDPPRGTLVWVHGGPEGQSRPGFLPILAFLVDEGFRLLVPNVRGSLGYGRTYVHLDDVRLRMDSVRDLQDLVGSDRAAQPSRADRSYGIIGGSYGGFMVLAALTTYPELWAAGVDIVGIANFITFLERTGAWRRKVREDEYGSLERDREFLRSISPLFQADRIVAPLLVIHGANDPRVPIHEAEQMVAALESRQVPVELLRYDNEGHGLVRRENQVEAYSRAAEFFDRHLTRGPTEDPR